MCCGKFAEVIGDDFLNKHKTLMPFLLTVGKDMLGSTSDEAIISTLQGMNEFIQNLEYDIKFYLQDTLDLLNQYISNPNF